MQVNEISKTFKRLSQTKIARYRNKKLLFLFTTLINIVDVLLNVYKCVLDLAWLPT